MKVDCDQCGGQMHVGGHGEYSCPHCGSLIDVVDANVPTGETVPVPHHPPRARILVVCPNCGARGVTNADSSELIVCSDCEKRFRAKQVNGNSVCGCCHTVGDFSRTTPGSFGVEFLLYSASLVAALLLGFWISFLIPLVYSAWRLAGRRPRCGECGSAEVIPVSSPKGRELVNQ
jgi:hypothetical protein